MIKFIKGNHDQKNFAKFKNFEDFKNTLNSNSQIGFSEALKSEFAKGISEVEEQIKLKITA